MVKTVCLGIDVQKLNKNKSNFKKNKIVSLQKHEVSHNTIRWQGRQPYSDNHTHKLLPTLAKHFGTRYENIFF